MVVPEGGFGVHSRGITRASQWGQCQEQAGKGVERIGRLTKTEGSLQQTLILLQLAGCWAVTLPLALALQQLHASNITAANDSHTRGRARCRHLTSWHSLWSTPSGALSRW
jgi:hypothetical protein